MNSYYKVDPWQIIEEDFNPAYNRDSESIFSIGNGYMGQRANFEESYSGDSLRGTYIAGVYYPDKTRVGWWKNGYPEYFAKVLNAPNWIGIDVSVDGELIDLSSCSVKAFRRVLDMKEGYLERVFTVTTREGKSIEISSRRFVSMSDLDIGTIRFSVKSIDLKGHISFSLYVDGDVQNEDTNYGEKFWAPVSAEISNGIGVLVTSTFKTEFHVANGMCFSLFKNGKEESITTSGKKEEKYISSSFDISFVPGDTVTVNKYVSVLSSLNIEKGKLVSACLERLGYAKKKGFDKMFSEHVHEWSKIWATSDVIIGGDVAAQQAIRFNIFQLNQTYTGKDARLNIGPKGFTGEKYGGSTYWDTEAFGLPFYLKTADPKVGRNLLLYRYKHLQKSIENAAKLGFKNGAALYPMVTMNGEECHNEWEITFEEIHRNGAIAFAVFNYIRHTGDEFYMLSHGLELLIGISRFWSQRATFSENLSKYVILGVTGPNEYENNVNNNWYTNKLAVWTLSYTLANIDRLKKSDPVEIDKLLKKINFSYDTETSRWKSIISDMHFPYDEKKKIFLQQDGFLDKEIKPAVNIPPEERPINQHWSWDRILRSCYIKQADVLQGIYLFEDQFDTETIKRNFDFYESITVHESSLSACIHSVLAARIGNIEKAYELYLRTARLDLDDYNKEVGDGLHITSMAGTWLAVVEGFGGMRISAGKLILNPLIPSKWEYYSFHARYKGILFEVKVTKDRISIRNMSDKLLEMEVCGKNITIQDSGDSVLDL